MKVGIIGAGTMGAGIAQAKFQLHLWISLRLKEDSISG